MNLGSKLGFSLRLFRLMFARIRLIAVKLVAVFLDQPTADIADAGTGCNLGLPAEEDSVSEVNRRLTESAVLAGPQECGASRF
jgi:hypothetical protein